MKFYFKRIWRQAVRSLSGSARRIWSVAFPRKKSLQLPAESSAAQAPLRVSVVISALNEQKNIAAVVQYALSDVATAEVIVIDDSSVDDTAQAARMAGARVITSSMLGKGASMQDGVRLASEEVIVFLDGDLSNLRPGIIKDMAEPIQANRLDFVKARFGRGAGRVTELTAKPMLKVFFPELSDLSQPLGGIIAARKTLLKQLKFEVGYGVDIGLLIGACRRGARIGEVDIGFIEHESQALADLAAMADDVSRVIYLYAHEAGRLHTEQIMEMFELQRHARATLDHVLSRRNGRTGLILIGLEDVLTKQPFLLQLAERAGLDEATKRKLESLNPGQITELHQIADCYRFVHQTQFERLASELELREGAIEFVNQARRSGFMVGVVSDYFFITAEIVRRRVFADFALGHPLRFSSGVCSGDISINSSFMPQDSAHTGLLNKSEIIHRLMGPSVRPRFKQIWAIGSSRDAGFLSAADRSFCVLNSMTDKRSKAESFEHFGELTHREFQRAA